MLEDIPGKTPGNDIAVSSRVRLARNLRKYPFPARMDKNQGTTVLGEVRDALFKGNEAARDLVYIDMQKLNPIDRQVLVEKHLISPDFAAGSLDRACVMAKDEKISLMINEEDHLRLQCIFPGEQLDAAWELCRRLDDYLEARLDFAFDKNYGYLTCCPTNIGTGIRASVMLHLPALVMTGYIKEVLEACGKLGIAVRGIYGENSEASGCMFQISNQVTLGQTEEDIIAGVRNAASQITEQERMLRGELYRQNSFRFEDKVFRSLGLLANARIMSAEESLKLLSDVRLGVDMKIIDGIKVEILDQMMLSIQPACLQKLAGKPLTPDERDFLRASLIRERLSQAK